MREKLLNGHPTRLFSAQIQQPLGGSIHGNEAQFTVEQHHSGPHSLEQKLGVLGKHDLRKGNASRCENISKSWTIPLDTLEPALSPASGWEG